MFRLKLLSAALLLATASFAASAAERPLEARYGLGETEFRAAHAQMLDQGLRLIDITVAELDGKPMPESMTKGQQLAQLQGKELICFGPQHSFTKFGANQTEICSLLPNIGSVIDEICLIRSMTTDAIARLSRFGRKTMHHSGNSLRRAIRFGSVIDLMCTSSRKVKYVMGRIL